MLGWACGSGPLSSGWPAPSPGLSRVCLVHAGAVSALAKFGAQNEEMLPSILVLLKRCVWRPLGRRLLPISVAGKGETRCTTIDGRKQWEQKTVKHGAVQKPLP